MKILKLLVLPIACLALSACPSKNHKSNAKKTIIKKYVVMGDPLNVIKGAKLSTEGAFERLKKYPVLHLNTAAQFSDKEEEDTSAVTQDSLESSEASEASYTPNSFYKFNVLILNPDTIFIQHGRPGSEDYMNMYIKRDATGRLLVSDIEGTTSGELIHFSETEDKLNFSILLYAHDKETDSKQITALYFSDNITPIQPTKTSKPYPYIEGPGIKFVWNASKDLVLEGCGQISKENHLKAKTQVEAWNRALTGIRTFKYKVAKEFYPFSDLNQSCIYFIDDLLVDNNRSSATLGMAISPRDYYKAEIIDSDVFIFLKEMKKSYSDFSTPEAVHEMNFSILHEIGHSLGLDHVFDDKIKSVMGYDFTIKAELHPYDVEAIRALYE